MEEIRKEFVIAAQHTSNFSSLCREFGITRKTGYKWVKRYGNGESLSDYDKTPHTISNKTPIDTEHLIVAMRKTNPGWGAKKIKVVLENQGFTMPCTKTVNNILKRNDCISYEESLKHRPFKRFEMDKCNDMWQIDFKGDFKMADGNRCYPLDIIDDHSRYVIRSVPLETTSNVVLPVLKEAFYRYGMPNSILSDNGAQFSGLHKGYTQFEKWLMNHDILPVHGRFYHPQTQGKIERFHRTMKQELLKHYTPDNIKDATRVFGEWVNKYNTQRPHEALNMKCPYEVYIPSKKEYVDKVKPFEYSGLHHVIKVNSWGYVRFDRFQPFLSETMVGEYIEFRQNPHGDSFIACYRNYAIAEFDTDSGKLIHRKIKRL